jgi:hypothetical protein
MENRWINLDAAAIMEARNSMGFNKYSQRKEYIQNIGEITQLVNQIIFSI